MNSLGRLLDQLLVLAVFCLLCLLLAVIPSRDTAAQPTNTGQVLLSVYDSTSSRLAVGNGTAVLTSLSAATADANGTAHNLGLAHKDWAFQVTTTGTPAGGTVTFQYSLNGTTWTSHATTFVIGTDANGLTKLITNVPATRVRLVLGSLSGGTAPTVTGILAGY